MSENTMNEAGNQGGSVTVELPKGFTYFVRDGDMIKIGSSMRPADRISSLQTGSSRHLETLAIVPIEIADEFKTHQLFSHLRVRGEWFRADRELLYFIEQVKAIPVVPILPVPEAAPHQPAPVDTAETVVRRLIAIRAAHGSDTPMGHACSNLAEQIKSMATYQRPDWASHECQTLPFMIGRQMKRLAELRAQNN